MNANSFPQNNPQQMMGNEELSIPLPQSREELSRLYTVSLSEVGLMTRVLILLFFFSVGKN